MSGRIGGTIEQMTTMGTRFTSEASELEGLVARIGAALDATDWEGGAAQRFREAWNGQFRSTFHAVSEGLRECGQEMSARANALTQAGG